MWTGYFNHCMETYVRRNVLGHLEQVLPEPAAAAVRAVLQAHLLAVMFPELLKLPFNRFNFAKKISPIENSLLMLLKQRERERERERRNAKRIPYHTKRR